LNSTLRSEAKKRLRFARAGFDLRQRGATGDPDARFAPIRMT